MELRRSDIGFGRVVIDDSHVTRRYLVRTKRVALADIREYRLRLVHRGASTDVERILFGGWTALGDAFAALRGEIHVRPTLELVTPGDRLRFGWRFERIGEAIAAVLAHIGPRLAERAHADLARAGEANFGPLGLARDKVAWGARSIPHGEVESIELFDSSPVALRVMKRGKVLPWAKAPLEDIPNPHVALALAAELGLPVRGRELF